MIGHRTPIARVAQWGQVIEVLLISEDRTMGDGKLVTALASLALGIVHREEPGYGLLLEPLPHVGTSHSCSASVEAHNGVPVASAMA